MGFLPWHFSRQQSPTLLLQEKATQEPIFFSTYFDPAVHGKYQPAGVSYVIETVDETLFGDPTEKAMKSLFEKAVKVCEEGGYAGIVNINIVFEKPFRTDEGHPLWHFREKQITPLPERVTGNCT